MGLWHNTNEETTERPSEGWWDKGRLASLDSMQLVRFVSDPPKASNTFCSIGERRKVRAVLHFLWGVFAICVPLGRFLFTFYPIENRKWGNLLGRSVPIERSHLSFLLVWWQQLLEQEGESQDSKTPFTLSSSTSLARSCVKSRVGTFSNTNLNRCHWNQWAATCHATLYFLSPTSVTAAHLTSSKIRLLSVVRPKVAGPVKCHRSLWEPFQVTLLKFLHYFATTSMPESVKVVSKSDSEVALNMVQLWLVWKEP